MLGSVLQGAAAGRASGGQLAHSLSNGSMGASSEEGGREDHLRSRVRWQQGKATPDAPFLNMGKLRRSEGRRDCQGGGGGVTRVGIRDSSMSVSAWTQGLVQVLSSYTPKVFANELLRAACHLSVAIGPLTCPPAGWQERASLLW